MAGSGTAHLRDREDVVLRVDHLVVEFTKGDQTVHAVSDVSLDLLRGETLGLVGESGCGKSTTGRAIMQLPRPTRGSVSFHGRDLTRLNEVEVREARRPLQMIFQDPISSLNPRRTVREIVAEAIRITEGKRAATGPGAKQRLEEVFTAVGLDLAAVGARRPHQFSGGQCQRIAIARALVISPEVLICDEPVSALDVSVQAQILNLLEDMKEQYGLTLLFIAHDLAVVKNISDRVAVMYLGKLCEIGPSEAVYERPLHPYTNALINSIPSIDVVPDPHAGPPLTGEIPSPIAPPSGCRFRTRCPSARERCTVEEPQIRALDDDHFVACHYPVDASVLGRSTHP